MKFSNVSSIEPDNKDTWTNKIFLTFDIDWANDDILNSAIDVVEDANVEATWFVTHDTPVLKRLRENPNFELGIHPNFNFILNGKFTSGINLKNIVQKCIDIVPEAKSVRSHSMTQSSVILNVFKEFGLTHDLNHFIPHHANIPLKPWKLWNGMIRVPYLWEDDVHIEYESMNIYPNNPLEIAKHVDGQSLLVFDFHPIHLFLNTESLDRYKRTKFLHQCPIKLNQYSYKGYGTHNRLTELLKEYNHL